MRHIKKAKMKQQINNRRQDMKSKSGLSGKSKSKEFPNGQRRNSHWGLRAPRSLRQRRVLLSSCTDKELEKAGIIK